MYRNMDHMHWPPLSGNGFWDFETSKLVRIFYMVEAKPENRGCMVSRKDFSKFVDQHDERYGTNFIEVFPELSGWWNDCYTSS